MMSCPPAPGEDFLASYLDREKLVTERLWPNGNARKRTKDKKNLPEIFVKWHCQSSRRSFLYIFSGKMTFAEEMRCRLGLAVSQDLPLVPWTLNRIMLNNNRNDGDL